ncbi:MULTISPECIES: FadR/GntR family transcriptional regulator [unclassified Pseudodesulfovibrio]|uniref:FadR/GntR family transcriptional regulator n=1 Tax=unclassified Pseudodesulfovibrio TaxID=2661612 RepID=UPI000FEC18C2|nr:MULTISPECIES: FadR/GntR family transcriptional regulator [unclassified Pseudodesulfovibrio]MCJ2165823.1 FadR family transcriptional regulator [Pseudodesulfovibrio sp. S3-i]RWU02747.1 FadR family transcriptional regulator [Pseudodesulfovibrio sp. S3]
MEAKPVQRKSISEEIVSQLKGMIDQGRLLPGDRLPAERKLAEQFGVSRTSVREGIKILAESGLLESRQGAGTFVSENEGGAREGSLLEAVLSGDFDLQDVFEVRKMLEPEIAALAARNGSPSAKNRLEAILMEQEQAIRSGSSGAGLDHQFHQALAEASGNPVLREMVSALHEGFARSREDIVQSPQRQEASLAAHRAIIEAVRNGHAMQAERAMREHLEEVERIIFHNQTYGYSRR